MKWYHSKISLSLITCFICLINIKAQEIYHERIHKSRMFWQQLIPSHSKIQYAGGIGLISAGIGWDYGSSNQWETDFLIGYVPRYTTENAKMTLTLKQNFLPWNKRRINDYFTFDPLTCGLAVNSILSNDFWVNEPEKYPNSYYSFSTKLRFWIHIGQRISFHIPEKKRFFARSVTVFYEISSNDLYLVNAFNNSYLTPSDYLRLAFGLKFQIF